MVETETELVDFRDRCGVIIVWAAMVRGRRCFSELLLVRGLRLDAVLYILLQAVPLERSIYPGIILLHDLKVDT